MSLLPITLPARAHAQLGCAGVRVSRGARPVFDGLDLTVSPGSRIGVVGENGRGKSTLLRTLSGDLTPDAGEVRLVGTIGAAEQEIPVAGDRTVGDLIDRELADVRLVLRAVQDSADALAAGRPGATAGYEAALDAAHTLGAWDADRRVQVALTSLGAVGDRTRELALLSVGQRYRIRLACLLGAGHDFLLLDEPTNHLDASGLAFLTDALLEHPGGVVLASHDRALLSDVATTIVDLDPSVDGRPRVYGDGYAGYVQGRAASRRRWAEEYERQRSEHARLARDLDAARGRLITGWRPDKGTGKHKRATRAPGLVQSAHRRRAELAAHAVTAPEPPLSLEMPALPARPGATLIEARGMRFPGRLNAVSLSLTSGDRLVVTGPNGAGKSTLLAALAGHLAPPDGTLRTAPGIRTALLTQESPPASPLTAREAYHAHVAALVTAAELASPPPEERDAESLELLTPESLGLLTPAEWDRPVATLSTGQQRRLDLAMAPAGRPHVLLLDEPTNHLSAALVDELTTALTTTAAAVVVATHDRQLLRDTAAWPRLPLATRIPAAK
ncbi:ATP-binding cassette domain-containing protein [Actinoplanes sp. NPDC051513]|uniref:ATP-binding cassette domain-containing protein n=1 Tax=Actinoplanes sp. NPDC051513 TaxID=3363908 RepID=UPI0037B73C6E